MLLAGKMPDLALSSMVPPAHTALRQILYPHFSPSATRVLEPFIRESVSALLDEACERGEIDELIAFEFDGETLAPEEILSNLYLLLIGATETLPKVFAGGVYQLWRHPEQRAELARHPGLSKDAFWEILRYEVPTLMLGATAEVPTEISDGIPIKVGQKVMHLWVSANRNEREFPDPDRLDIHRRAARILGFNHGRHRCLGAQVAQLEGRVLLEELLARAPNFESDEKRPVRIRSEFLRGFDSLPILLGDRL